LSVSASMPQAQAYHPSLILRCQPRLLPCVSQLPTAVRGPVLKLRAGFVQAADVLKELLTEVGLSPGIMAECVRTMQKRAGFFGQMSREAPDCWPACIQPFQTVIDVLET
jgi:hypothetical protein